ncbi:hypothetical protein B0H19DRAFT_1056221 [Mycena capillaripes]|nr:hypothetical protein B0H19DRAFT_1056221 [Mycena capillaripes]
MDSDPKKSAKREEVRRPRRLARAKARARSIGEGEGAIDDGDGDGQRQRQRWKQADNNLVMSTTFPTFQAKVTTSWNWTTHKRAFVSANTSRWQIYGPLPAVIPQLMLGDLVVKMVPEFKYVGLWFTSVHANIFARHYTIKASKARGVANAVFGLKHRIGSLPV